MLVAFTMG